MTKRLLSLVAVAALTTSAMAYNANELGSMEAGNNVNITGIALSKLLKKSNQLGNALLFPAYFVGGNWQTTIRVINTSDKAVVAKVVFYDGKDSHELRDFNIYLSANDEWIGELKTDTDGTYKVFSNDGSTPLTGKLGEYPMASADKQFVSKSLESGNGYFEVIGMVATDRNNGMHGKHAQLREAYTKFAHDIRNQGTIFADGINKYSNFPYVKWTINSNDGNGTYTDSGKSVDVNFTGVPVDALTGDVRITDTVNGKDMVMPALALEYNTSNPNYKVGSDTNDSSGLVYLEGEKANIADVFIEYNVSKTNYYEYNIADLNASTAMLGAKKAYITYGDAPVNNMYALITSPFKRLIVSQKAWNNHKIDGNSGTVLTDYFGKVTYDKTSGAVTNWGSYSLIANIYNTDEVMMSAGQFSPATTPTLTFTKELANTGYDATDSTKLPFYLTQAQGQGFTKGYVVLSNTTGKEIPGYITQMIATTAGSKVVTNWIVPATK